MNLATNELEFSFPDSGSGSDGEVVYQQPLTKQIAVLEEELTNTQIALADTYEQLIQSQDETTNLQIALVDVYEQLLLLSGGDN